MKWKQLSLGDNAALVVNNAYKSFDILDSNNKVIGHYRGDDDLKTSCSYRTIPIVDKNLIQLLLQHKKRQQEKFKKFRRFVKEGRKWTENDYVFIGRTYKPYVSNTLSSELPEMCKKYKLPPITPYVLRHTFATNLFEKGVNKLTLMKLMGHNNLETLHRYYVNVSFETKRKELEKTL